MSTEEKAYERLQDSAEGYHARIEKIKQQLLAGECNPLMIENITEAMVAMPAEILSDIANLWSINDCLKSGFLIRDACFEYWDDIATTKATHTVDQIYETC